MPSDQDITFIGKCNFRGNDKVFGIKAKDRRQHMYVVGKTGVGKTALLKNLALQDIRSGRGIGIIDPHGEFVEEVLSQIPSNRVEDVVYFNPVDSDYPIGFNVLEVPDPKYKHLIVSDLLGIFTKIWANVWSARMEYILQNCILALIDTPGTTLLGIPRLLVDKNYREKIVSNVKDPVVKSFWVHEYETWRDQFRNEAIVPIQNKVGQFLNTYFIRNIVGQAKSTLNIPDIMNSGKILLINVSKGKVGEDNSALLGAMIITKIQLTAMERVRIPEEERRDFYLYVDEFQNFATDSFASILSEARKYRLNLLIAHQYVGQLVTDVSTKVRDAVFGNVGTMISFRVGAIDAEFLEKEFTPEFMMQDLINLPNYNIYLKLMVDGLTSRPFSAATLPPLKFETDPDVQDKIIKSSRAKYAKSRAEVENEISMWSGFGGDGGLEEIVEKKLIESPCWNCGKTATVPFKPDGKRPVYCMDCLKKIEAGTLIPLPERMPQVGRAKFGATLGDVGIEFPSSRQPEQQPTPAPRPFGQPQPVPAPRPFRPEQRSVPPPYPARREGDTGFGRERPEFRRRPPPSRDFGEASPPPRTPFGTLPSRPVSRTPMGGKSVSLSELRLKEDRRPENYTENFDKNTTTRPSVNVTELKKLLEESLNKESGANNAGGDKESKVIKPGEAVKF
ncbi:MAG: type IV secretion system DNA-binding domain-containing protein [bacterium]|nr:type IV secretion system DNA-binding domain-containing protein [bacterium]